MTQLKRITKAQGGVSLDPIKRKEARLQSYNTKHYNDNGQGRANFQTAMINAKSALRKNSDLRGRDLRNAAKNMVAGNYDYVREELPELPAINSSAILAPQPLKVIDNSKANFDAAMAARQQENMAAGARRASEILAAREASAKAAATPQKPKVATSVKPATTVTPDNSTSTYGIPPKYSIKPDEFNDTPATSGMKYLYRNRKLQVLPEGQLTFTNANEENMYRDQNNNLYYMDPRGVYYKVTGGRGYSGNGDLAKNISGQIDRLWDTRPTTAPSRQGKTYTVPQEWMDEAAEYTGGTQKTISPEREAARKARYLRTINYIADSTTD